MNPQRERRIKDKRFEGNQVPMWTEHDNRMTTPITAAAVSIKRSAAVIENS